MKDILRSRKYQYVVLDVCAVKPEVLIEMDADLRLAVLPPVHRFTRALDQLEEAIDVQFIASDKKTSNAWVNAINYVQNCVGGKSQKVLEVRVLSTADLSNFKGKKRDRDALGY